ncbi:putative short-chain dehydrogenase [Bombardia bombarda]|uniref:Short-chain dehydrogenase n=1 Tax=Bombardia bombarda TaxID=252184 RepID=A0AA40BW36_9PEZI|nr:putative short-chain dehydrogenase [Bombardia bombarda]
MTNPTTKTLVLITGANQGIGFGIAEHLIHLKTFHVLIGARSEAKAEAAVKQLQAQTSDAELTAVVIDVTNDLTIAAAAKAVTEKFGHLDLLINNAGIASGTLPDDLTARQEFAAIYDTNVIGAMAVTEAFLPLLRASTYQDRRIVNVSSGLGQIGLALAVDHQSGAKAIPAPAYRASKAALNMLTAVYAANLRDEDILAVPACPGYARTNLTRGQGRKTASEGARIIVRAAIEGDAKTVYGTFVADDIVQYGW